MVHVKICCIKSIAEAEMAVNAGANAIGLVGHMPSGPGVISDEMISTIIDFFILHLRIILTIA